MQPRVYPPQDETLHAVVVSGVVSARSIRRSERGGESACERPHANLAGPSRFPRTERLGRRQAHDEGVPLEGMRRRVRPTARRLTKERSER